MATTETEKTRRTTTKVGVVTSNAADKSVVVKVENFVMHPLYHRFVGGRGESGLGRLRYLVSVSGELGHLVVG